MRSAEGNFGRPVLIVFYVVKVIGLSSIRIFQVHFWKISICLLWSPDNFPLSQINNSFLIFLIYWLIRQDLFFLTLIYNINQFVWFWVGNPVKLISIIAFVYIKTSKFVPFNTFDLFSHYHLPRYYLVIFLKIAWIYPYVQTVWIRFLKSWTCWNHPFFLIQFESLLMLILTPNLLIFHVFDLKFY